MRHKARAEEREDRRRRPCRRHCRENERERRAEGPVREAAEALPLGAEALGKYLGYEDPDDDALSKREENDEREYAERCEKPKIEHERRRCREMRGDAANGTDNQQRAASKPVDEKQSRERAEPEHHAHRRRRAERCRRREARHLENALREIHHRVDA